MGIDEVGWFVLLVLVSCLVCFLMMEVLGVCVYGLLCMPVFLETEPCYLVDKVDFELIPLSCLSILDPRSMINFWTCNICELYYKICTFIYIIIIFLFICLFVCNAWDWSSGPCSCFTTKLHPQPKNVKYYCKFYMVMHLKDQLATHLYQGF